MSGVCLEALPSAVVPQFESVVQRRREDVLAVGRELDEGDRRVVVVDQRFQTLARRCVPDSTVDSD